MVRRACLVVTVVAAISAVALAAAGWGNHCWSDHRSIAAIGGVRAELLRGMSQQLRETSVYPDAEWVAKAMKNQPQQWHYGETVDVRQFHETLAARLRAAIRERQLRMMSEPAPLLKLPGQKASIQSAPGSDPRMIRYGFERHEQGEGKVG